MNAYEKAKSMNLPPLPTITRRAPKPKRRYPEQSARQALRGMRRAQGGPGLLRMTNGSYVPRNAVNA